MDRDELNNAIMRLRTIKRTAAARAAKQYAARLLPTSAHYNTPADLVAVGTLSIALYYVAATYTAGINATNAMCSLIEQRYCAIRDGAATHEALRASVDYPEELRQQLRAITQLPPLVVLAGMGVIRELVFPKLLDRAPNDDAPRASVLRS